MHAYIQRHTHTHTQVMLQQGGMGCAQGGETGTFTPMYLVVARKKK